MCVCLVVCERDCFLRVIYHPINLIGCQPPLLHISLSSKGGDNEDIPLGLNALKSLHFLHVVQIWVSVLVPVYYKKKPLRVAG